MTDIGLLHPGAMGESVARSLKQTGQRVVWIENARSAATSARARSAGLEPVQSLAELCGQCTVVVSVCPPHAAVALAKDVAAAGFAGVYVDANAVSPVTAREVAAAVEVGGASFVDAGIIGPPAHQAGTTRLYLSGERAHEVVPLFEGALLEPRIVDNRPGSASALKMVYAAFTKGTTALLLNIRALAAREGVQQSLLDEWQLSQTGVTERSERAARDALKAWRFEGEMHEIANTFAAAELPDEFHRGAASVYARLTRFKDADPPSLDDVLSELLKR